MFALQRGSLKRGPSCCSGQVRVTGLSRGPRLWAAARQSHCQGQLLQGEGLGPEEIKHTHGKLLDAFDRDRQRSLHTTV